MKKLLLYIGVVFVLTSCSQKQQITLSETKTELSPLDDVLVAETIKTMKVDSTTFHFIADWLSNTEVVYVERADERYDVKTFDMNTGLSKVIYKDSSIIVDVRVHPSKKALLLHTSHNASSAEVKIISLDGKVMNEFSIASSEIEIEWNDINPDLVIVTAFKEDWSYHTYLYNGESNQLKSISLADPFPKWLGTEKVAIVDDVAHSSDGGALLLYDLVTGLLEPSDIDRVVHKDTYKDSLLTVQMMDEINAEYTIVNRDQEAISSWTMPVIRQFSEWTFPEINWLSEKLIMMAAQGEDYGEDSFGLYLIEDGEQELVSKNLVSRSLRCSPNGEKCLTGFRFEAVIDMNNATTLPEWIRFDES